MSENDRVFEFAAKLDKEIKAVIMAALDEWGYKSQVTEYYVTPMITVDFLRKVAKVDLSGAIKLEL